MSLLLAGVTPLVFPSTARTPPRATSPFPPPSVLLGTRLLLGSFSPPLVPFGARCWAQPLPTTRVPIPGLYRQILVVAFRAWVTLRDSSLLFSLRALSSRSSSPCYLYSRYILRVSGCRDVAALWRTMAETDFLLQFFPR